MPSSFLSHSFVSYYRLSIEIFFVLLLSLCLLLAQLFLMYHPLSALQTHFRLEVIHKRSEVLCILTEPPTLAGKVSCSVNNTFIFVQKGDVNLLQPLRNREAT